MTPTGFGVFPSSQSCGLLRRRLFVGFGPHVEHKSSAEAYYDNVNPGAPFLHANAVSRRKENRSSPKTPAKSWVLENSLGALAKVIPQSKNRSVFWRNEGEQSLEITTGQVGKVTDRRAVSSKTLLSFRMFLDSRYVCIVLWPVYETDSSIKLSYLSRNIHKVDDAKAGNTFTTFFNTSRSLQYDQVKKKDWAVHIFKSQC